MCPSPKAIDAILKVEALIAQKQKQTAARRLSAILCNRFALTSTPELLIALAPETNALSIEDAVAFWVSRQSADPAPQLSEASIESYATLLRHKLWALQDDLGSVEC